MRKTLGRILLKMAYVLQRTARLLHELTQDRPVRSWYADNGDKTLRLDYDLTVNSLVFDIGGYEGQWASDIFSRYRCTIHIFEAMPAFAESIQRRFSRNPSIHVHPFGVARAGGTARISCAGSGSSLFKGSSDLAVMATLIDITEFFRDNDIRKIDLMKINIEGGEYDLLDILIERDLIAKIQNLQVQFHDFVPNADKRMKNIQESLSKTHVLTYQYLFVWENWKLRSDNI